MKRIILTGGGARLGKLSEYMEERTGIAVRYGDHSHWLAPESDRKYGGPEYAQIIGTLLLASSNVADDNQTVSLPNEEGRAKKKSRRKSIGESITQGLFRFFEDDTNLRSSKENGSEN